MVGFYKYTLPLRFKVQWFKVQACPACPGATCLANIAISILFISFGNTD